MKTIIFTFVLLLFSCKNIYSHTCSPEKVKCPIDKTEVEFCVTMSMTTFGSYYDFQKKGAIGNHYEELINSCPKCYYSGYKSDFDTTFNKVRINEIKDFLSQYSSLKIDDVIECKIAGELKEFMEERNDLISNYFLVGTYLARFDTTRTALRKELQNKTKLYLEKAIRQNEYEDESILANINYLIAEMCRRTGDFVSAIRYYEKAINDPNKQDWVEEVATRQKELAIKKDDNNMI